MDSLVFKEALETDLQNILNIYNFYIANSTANYYINEISINQLKNHIFINHEKYKTFLIFNNDNMIGFCFITQFRKKEAYSRTAEIGIYLKSEYTGKKFGEKIISYLEKVANDNNIKVLVASISSENIPSLRLVIISFTKQAKSHNCLIYYFFCKKVLTSIYFYAIFSI